MKIILFEQIRTIDKQRLREYLGTLDRHFIHCADKALAISIGLAIKGFDFCYNNVKIILSHRFNVLSRLQGWKFSKKKQSVP